MINQIRNIIKKIYLKRLIKKGLVVGKNFQMEKGCNIDANFPWLITIGNNVTFSSWVYLTAHDGASQKHIGYSRIGKITIGDNVFIGAKSIIMPNVSIGNNSIIGAGSIVTQNIPDNVIAVGVPAKVVGSIFEYEKKLKNRKENSFVYEKEYILRNGITKEKMQQMKEELEIKEGFIV